MKKVLCAILFVFVIPFVSSADFSQDLKYGMKNSDEVKSLQSFLQQQGLFSGLPTGNYYAITQKAVKTFQVQQKIKPANGIFSGKTRLAANSILAMFDNKPADNIATPSGLKFMDSLPQTTTPSIPATTNTQTNLLVQSPVPVVDICNNIEGVQSYTPAGMAADGSGNCIIPTQTPNLTLTPAPTASAIKAVSIENQITNYLQTLNSQIAEKNQNIAAQRLAQSLKAPKPSSGCQGTLTSNGCILAPTQPSFYVCVDCSIVAQLEDRRNRLNSIYNKVQNYAITGVMPPADDITFLASIGINW